MLDSNMGGSDYKQLAQEFLAIARMRPNNNRLCLHAMLALPHRDESHELGAINETLLSEQWVEIGQRWLGEMGFDDNQYFMVRHTDTEHDHLHIVASRVKLDGEVVSDSHNYHRSEAIIRKIEQDYKLEAVTPSWETYRRAPGRAELKEFERTGTDSVRLTIAALARDAASSHPTMPEYMERMRELGVGVEVHANRNGFIRGLSYEMNGYPFQGGDIGKDYTWNGLQQYLGVTYVASRDFETICTKERSTSGSSYKSARTSKSVGNGSSTVESTGSQPAAADNQSDERKQRLEAAVSQLNRSTDQLTAAVNQFTSSTSHFDRWLEQVDKLSRERTKQPSRNLAVAPNGAGSKSGGAGEDTGNNRQLLAAELDQLGAAVHEFNAELEAQPVRHQAAGNGSRTESREARASNSTTSTTTGWSQADVHRQFEEINRIHDGIRQKRRGAVIELEKDLAETFNQLDTESLKSTETKSRLTAAQKQWESSPVWQERSDWERNMITAAFEELKTSDFGLNEMKGATFGNGQYKAYLVNFTSLYIFCETLPITSYSSYRDSVAHECTLTPQHQQYFLPPGQRLENSQEIDAPAQLGFFDSHRTPSSSKPIEISNTTNAPNRPSPKLQLPKNKESRPAYLDKIYQRLAAEVRKVSSGIPTEALDVGIATLAYEEGYSSSDVRCILLRSPKSKDFPQSPDLFDKFSEYIEQRKAISLTERQLFHDPELNKRVEIVKPIIEEFCKDLADGKQIDGTGYTLKLNGDTRTIIAHDGRGEVLKLTGRWVEHCELTDNDVQFFQKAAAQLAEFERQYRQRMRDSTNKPNRTQKQMEL